MSDVTSPEPAPTLDTELSAEPRFVQVQTWCLVILTTIAVIWAMSVGAEIIVPLLLAAVLKLLLQPTMRLLCDRLGLPVALATLLVMVVMFGVLIAIGLAIAVPAAGWFQKLPQALQSLQERFGFLQAPIDGIRAGLGQFDQMTRQQVPDGAMPPVAPTGPPSPQATSKVETLGISILLGAEHFMGRFFVLVVLLFFMLAAGDSMLRRLVEVTPNFSDKKHVVFISNEIERNVSGYLQTISAINLLVGVVNGLVFWLLGVADPLLWGTLAFLLNFIPIVGPLTGVGTMLLVGLLTFKTVGQGLLPAGAYLLIHLCEGQMLTPMLLARRFTLNPVLVIVSLFFWNWLWGVPGALLSVPLLAVAKIICDRIPSLAALGHLLGSAPRTVAPRETVEAG